MDIMIYLGAGAVILILYAVALITEHRGITDAALGGSFLYLIVFWATTLREAGGIYEKGALNTSPPTPAGFVLACMLLLILFLTVIVLTGDEEVEENGEE